jgi:surface protein
MFYGCIKFNGNLSNWNMTNVDILDHMFYRCYKFNQDLTNWKFKQNLLALEGVFEECSSFEGKGLEKWDVHMVEYFDKMFYNCNNLSCNLEKWDISNVKTFADMFKGVDKKIIPSWY